MLSRNRGKCNLIAADIEAAIDTERAGGFLYRGTSNTAHALWEDEYTRSQTQCVCVCVTTEKQKQTYVHTRAHTGRRLLRNLLVSFVSFYFSNILSKQTKRFTADMVCVPSLEGKSV